MTDSLILGSEVAATCVEEQDSGSHMGDRVHLLHTDPMECEVGLGSCGGSNPIDLVDPLLISDVNLMGHDVGQSGISSGQLCGSTEKSVDGLNLGLDIGPVPGRTWAWYCNPVRTSGRIACTACGVYAPTCCSPTNRFQVEIPLRFLGFGS